MPKSLTYLLAHHDYKQKSQEKLTFLAVDYG